MDKDVLLSQIPLQYCILLHIRGTTRHWIVIQVVQRNKTSWFQFSKPLPSDEYRSRKTYT